MIARVAAIDRRGRVLYEAGPFVFCRTMGMFAEYLFEARRAGTCDESCYMELMPARRLLKFGDKTGLVVPDTMISLFEEWLALQALIPDRRG